MVLSTAHLTIGLRVAGSSLTGRPLLQIETAELLPYVRAFCAAECHSLAPRQLELVLAYTGPVAVDYVQPTAEAVESELQLCYGEADAATMSVTRELLLAYPAFDRIKFWQHAGKDLAASVAAPTAVVTSAEDFPVRLGQEEFSYTDLMHTSARKQIVIKSAGRAWIGRNYKAHAWPAIFERAIARQSTVVQQFAHPLQLTMPGMRTGARCALRVTSIGQHIIAATACLEPVRSPRARIRVPVQLV